MLTSTFIHCQGIGERTERQIWQAGARDWHTFLAYEKDLPITNRQRALLVPTIERSIERLKAGDGSFFARAIRQRDHWRAYSEFRSKMAFLDIETTGMGYDSAITVIGLYDGNEVKSYIRGFNLQEFEREIQRYDLIVTFFGSGFDLPHIRYAFPGLRLEMLHIDLCPLYRRLGITGGLKNIEKALGIRRADETRGLDGWDAVRLWHEWENGSREALDLLLAYNREDITNLAPLLEHGYVEMRKRCFLDG